MHTEIRYYRRSCLARVWKRLVPACPKQRMQPCWECLETTHVLLSGFCRSLAWLRWLRGAGGGSARGPHPWYGLADRSYDAGDLYCHIKLLGYDRVLYLERNTGWLRQGYRIATRYEKAAAN